jgi:hypothetical protein
MSQLLQENDQKYYGRREWCVLPPWTGLPDPLAAVQRGGLPFPSAEHTIEVTGITVADPGGYFMNRHRRISQQRLGRPQTAAGQESLQGEAGDSLEDPAEVRAADARRLRHLRETGPLLGASLDVFNDPPDDLEMLNRDFILHWWRRHTRFRLRLWWDGPVEVLRDPLQEVL